MKLLGKPTIIVAVVCAAVLISLVVVLLRPATSMLAELGMRDKMVEEVRQLLNQRQGMIVVCGPQNAGKKLTIDAALSDIGSGSLKIFTIAYSTERRLGIITHILDGMMAVEMA